MRISTVALVATFSLLGILLAFRLGAGQPLSLWWIAPVSVLAIVGVGALILDGVRTSREVRRWLSELREWLDD